jgi:hypothetical protein
LCKYWRKADGVDSQVYISSIVSTGTRPLQRWCADLVAVPGTWHRSLVIRRRLTASNEASGNHQNPLDVRGDIPSSTGGNEANG